MSARKIESSTSTEYRVMDSGITEEVNIPWVNAVPQFLRDQFVTSVFPRLKWLGSKTNIKGVLHKGRYILGVYTGKSKFIIAYIPDQHSIYAMYDMFTVGLDQDYIIVVSGRTYEAQPCDTNNDCYARVMSEITRERSDGVNINKCEKQCKKNQGCNRCARVLYERLESKHLAEKIDICVNYVTGTDITCGLRTLLRGFTFYCIWRLRWEETGNPSLPKDIVTLILKFTWVIFCSAYFFGM